MIRNAAQGISAVPMERFQGKPCRVYEFARDGGVMVMDPEATGLASFDKEHVAASFRCTMNGMVVCPPDIHTLDQMVYVGRCLARKGGYNDLLRKMVVAASLHRGTFTDGFLWQLQNEPNTAN